MPDHVDDTKTSIAASETGPQNFTPRIEFLAPGDVFKNPRNARRHSEKQYKHLMASIGQAGFVQPVLVNRDGMLVAGHARLEAAKRLGLATIPVIRLPHLDDASCRALMLGDNRIAEYATWDEDALKVEMGELSALEVSFNFSDVTGFESPEIDASIHAGDFGTSDTADAVVPKPPNQSSIVKLGDAFDLGRHALLCGDCRDRDLLEGFLGKARPTQIVTDPPYNRRIQGDVSGKGKARHGEFVMASGEMSTADYVAFNQAWLQTATSVVEPGALTYAFIDGLHLADLVNGAKSAGLTLLTVAVWDKGAAGMGSLYRSQVEHVCVFKAARAPHINNVRLGRYGRNRTTLWQYPGLNSFSRDRDAALSIHPTVKPVAMLADIMLDASRRGDAVFDPFLGSGSSIIAADRTGRVGLGVEIDPRFVHASLDRLSAVLSVDPVRRRDGALWSQIKTLSV